MSVERDKSQNSHRAKTLQKNDKEEKEMTTKMTKTRTTFPWIILIMGKGNVSPVRPGVLSSRA